MSFEGLNIAVDERPGYLFLIEEGAVGPRVDRYLTELERLGAESGRKRLLVDARGRSDVALSDPVWGWFDRQGVYAKLAFVFDDDLTVAECNMKALSRGLPVRSFAQVQLAQRWLFRERRRTTSSLLPPSRD